MKKEKLSKIAGICGLIIGVYMILVYHNTYGSIPASLGLLLILWRYK